MFKRRFTIYLVGYKICYTLQKIWIDIKSTYKLISSKCGIKIICHKNTYYVEHNLQAKTSVIKNHVHLYQLKWANLFSLVPPFTDLVHWANPDTQLLKRTSLSHPGCERTEVNRITDPQILLVCKQNWFDGTNFFACRARYGFIDTYQCHMLVLCSLS